MRHAKSDWTGAHSDHNRPLNARGRRSAPLVAAELVDRGWVPEAIQSSDATRTHETLLLMADVLGDPAHTLMRRLYLADAEIITGTIGALPESISTVLLLGHNPGISIAVLQLSGANFELKTANCALLESEQKTWAETVADLRQYTFAGSIVARELDD